MQNEPSKRVPVKKHPGIYKRGKRYTFPYRDSEGRQHWKTVEGGLQDALDARNELRRRKRGGERVVFDNRRLTFRDAAREFFVAKSGSLGERTPKTYKEQLERVYPYIGGRLVTSLRREDIAAMVGELSKKYAPSTVDGTLTPVSRVLRYARVSPNPVSELERDERPRVESREKRILTTEEIQKLIAACSDTYRPLIQTALFTGARQMELLGLTWADVSFDKQAIRVRAQLSRETGERKELKTGAKARRTIHVPPFLVQMLREHKARSPFSKDSDYVFTTGSGKPFGWSNVDRQGLHRARERAGISNEPRLTFHQLRHGFVSMLIAQGRPISYVAGQIGDSVKTTLDVYAHLFDEAAHADESRAAMEAAFGNSVVTGASESSEVGQEAEVVNIASVQGNR